MSFRYTVENFHLIPGQPTIVGTVHRTRQEPETFLAKQIIDGRDYEFFGEVANGVQVYTIKRGNETHALKFTPIS